MQDIGGGGDGVAGVEEGQAREVRGRHEAEGRRLVPADVAVDAGLDIGGGNLVALVYELAGLAKGVAGAEGAQVRLEHDGVALELVGGPANDGVHGAAEEPEDEPEGVEVARAEAFLGAKLKAVEGCGVVAGDVDPHEAIGREGPIIERIALVAGLAQVGRVELAFVDDEEAAADEIAKIRLEGGGVHRHERVRVVARGVDVVAGERELEAGHAGERAGRCANFGGVVGQGGEIVPVDGCGTSELRTGELHPVAGVTGKADRDTIARRDSSGKR